MTAFLTPLLALQIACRPSHRAIVAPEQRVTASPATVDLGPTAIDGSDSAVVQLSVSTPRDRAVIFELVPDDGSADGVSLDVDTGTVDGTDGLDVELTWVPTSGTAHSSLLLVLDADDDAVLVEIPVAARVDPDGDDDGDAHPAAGGGDCDDGDPAISSDAAETWYDGIDQDCDGNDTDADRDGFDGDGGPDCDDGDASVYPGAEDGLDGIDEDCDGVIDEAGASAASAVFVGLETSSDTGAYVESLGLFLRDAVSVHGWRVQAGAGDPTPLTHDAASAPGPWLHLCPPDAVAESCGVVLDPWPDLSATEDALVLTVDGREIDSLSWDASWSLEGRDLQLDSARAVSGENDASDDWCSGFEPGVANTRCD